jgi:hypothetical protein
MQLMGYHSHFQIPMEHIPHVLETFAKELPPPSLDFFYEQLFDLTGAPDNWRLVRTRCGENKLAFVNVTKGLGKNGNSTLSDWKDLPVNPASLVWSVVRVMWTAGAGGSASTVLFLDIVRWRGPLRLFLTLDQRELDLDAPARKCVEVLKKGKFILLGNSKAVELISAYCKHGVPPPLPQKERVAIEVVLGALGTGHEQHNAVLGTMPPTISDLIVSLLHDKKWDFSIDEDEETRKDMEWLVKMFLPSELHDQLFADDSSEDENDGVMCCGGVYVPP